MSFTPFSLESFKASALSIFSITSLCLAGLMISACDDDNQGVSCANDDACARGQICESGRCTTVPCAQLGDCPGTSRTCLSDLLLCSVKECGDIVNDRLRECAEGQLCLMQGEFRFSCITESAGGCVSPEDCLGSPDGELCCEGSCQASCEPTPAGMSAGTSAGTTAGMPAGTTAGTMMTEPAHLCSPCRSNGECADLGEGASCTAIGEGSFCTQACDASTPCPGGYSCVEMFGQCIPNGFQCVACLQEPCAEGFCDIATEECVPPQGRCATCTEDAACAQGRLCRSVNNVSRCVDSCEAGCPNGTSCQEGACIPEDQSSCDPCVGECGGDTPYCVAEEGRCAECGPGAPCEAGFNCDVNTNSCVEAMSGACLSDADCPMGVCIAMQCRECLQDSDCPSRNRCDTNSFTCVYEACAGVECQRGSTCDSSTGRCTPGCATAADCALPDTMDCNTETGQCFYKDGTCDFGGDGVCAPGGQCVPNPLFALDPSLPPNCSCAKEDPTDPASADRIGCHPGTTCTDLGALLSTFGLDPSTLGLEFEATCGVSPF